MQAAYEGTDKLGAVFTLDLGTGTLLTLHNFTGGSDGQYPYGPPSFDAQGNAFGATSTSVYELTAGTNAFTSPASTVVAVWR